jgi:DNA polymerase-3 subunit gamma/tau
MGADVMFTEKYRPYFITDLVGQGRAKKTIGAWLRTGRIPRSILISGVTSAGKTTLARIIARTALCLDAKDGVACMECRSCKQFDTSRDGHLAYSEMNAASERGIADMRELTKKIAARPMMSKHKVIVLDEAHMITKPGWNAMLKPLEEPPSHVIFIILTTEPEKLPDTIRNRCSKIKLPGITVDECTKLLVEVSKDSGLGKAGLEKKHLTEIAKAVKAHPRDALHALDQVYTMVLDAQDAGQTISDSIINGFIKDVAVSDIENMAAQVVRKVLTGKPGGALALAGD